MNIYVKRFLKIKHKSDKEILRLINELVYENECLEYSIEQVTKYYSPQKFNLVFRRGWSPEECAKKGRKIKKASSIDSEDEFPLAAWADYLGEDL